MFVRNWDLPPGKAHNCVLKTFRSRNRADWSKITFSHRDSHYELDIEEGYLFNELDHLRVARDLIVGKSYV